MKKTLFLALLAALALAACQDEKASVAQPSAQAVAPAQQINRAGQQAITSKNTVAVTKSDAGNTAKSIQAAMHDTKATKNPLGQISQHTIAEQLKTAPSTASAQVPVKSATVEKVKHTVTATKTAPIHTQVVVAQSAIKDSAQVVAGDAVKGKKIARKCQACHKFTSKKKVGPGLKGIFGRKAGIMPDMKYSKALGAGGWVWDEEHLHAWDCDSRKAIKVFSGDPSAKTKMPPQHICSAEKQANLIAFLKTL